MMDYLNDASPNDTYPVLLRERNNGELLELHGLHLAQLDICAPGVAVVAPFSVCEQLKGL